MDAIRNYNDTQCDLIIAENRLNLLKSKKEKIYTKYFPLVSKNSETRNSQRSNNDKIGEYLAELDKPNPITGISLSDELEEVKNEVNELKYYIKLMDNAFEQLEGTEIEIDLYTRIVKNRVNISQAVEEVASDNGKDISTIWRIYRKNVKKYIKKLKKIKMLVK